MKLPDGSKLVGKPQLCDDSRRVFQALPLLKSPRKFLPADHAVAISIQAVELLLQFLLPRPAFYLFAIRLRLRSVWFLSETILLTAWTWAGPNHFPAFNLNLPANALIGSLRPPFPSLWRGPWTSHF